MCPVFFVRIFGMGVERGLMRSADLDAGVDKIRQEIPFFVCFGAARAGFGVGGRTFFQILEILFYFGARAGRIWSRR